MSAAEKANLARIRDNQRRSRARRKEYLQELEARLRQCELQGIEASAEIQLAARRVADENKKLRILLGQHGVGEDNVEAFLQSTASSDTLIGAGSYGSMGAMGSGAVQVLENLLHTRKQCCSDASTGTTGPIAAGTGARSRDSSAGSMTTVQSVWDPAYTSHMRSQNDSMNMGSAGKQSQHQFMTPSSSASRNGSVVSIGRGSISGMPVQQQVQQQQSQQQSQQVQQQQHQQQQQRNRMNSNPPPMVSSAGPVTQQAQPHYDFDPQIAMPPSFHNQQRHHPHQNMPTTAQLAQAHTQPHQLAPGSRSSQYVPTTSTSGVVGGTNCVFATDMITSMAGGDPRVVRAELGCLPHCDTNMECEVDNQIVFNVMDRYTGQGIGL